MPERENQPRQKAGVHGWRAFLLMFGCGTTAALLVVGLFFGAVRMLGAAVLPGGDEPPAAAVPEGSWEPAPSMTPGALDLCSTLETSAQTGAFKTMFPKRLDDDGDYTDPGPSASDRTISDDCKWALRSPEQGEWRFRLTYEASAADVSESVRVSEAEAAFAKARGEIDSKFSTVTETEKMGRVAEQAYAQYGASSSGDTESLYIFLGRSRSGVFRMDISSLSQEVSEAEFRELARSLAPVLSTRLERILPA
ncbi:hypothetical protein [Streptomonospora litoralis]|uniref:DUF3558 domain-containing protein n=1 Tax=Streptomonospora litoralis TaxID=2498135 RepID=A0A4P6PWI4_9ACTN|nr:hypothetical protein [Streptomonospora litoralis]QBI52538.1 hypothetical protein EKD16_03640 [Streptomonospora litoralis]